MVCFFGGEFRARTFAAGAVCACLGACGGSGSSDALQNGFVLDAGEEGSGLPFAGEGGTDSLGDLGVGDTFKVRLVSYQNIEDGPQIVSDIETITLVSEVDHGGGVIAEMTLGDRTVEIPLDVSVPLTLEGVGDVPGEEIIRLAGADVGEFSAVYNLYSTTLPTDAITRDGHFVLGFLTDPADISNLGGVATFEGGFSGFGARLSADDVVIEEEVSVTGDITLSADFDRGVLNGGISAAQIDDFVGLPLRAIRGEIPETTINGNTFETQFPGIECNGLSCVSDTTLGGGFYGPAANEVSGIIAFDITGTDEGSGDTERFIATAGFTTE